MLSLDFLVVLALIASTAISAKAANAVTMQTLWIWILLSCDDRSGDADKEVAACSHYITLCNVHSSLKQYYHKSEGFLPQTSLCHSYRICWSPFGIESSPLCFNSFSAYFIFSLPWWLPLEWLSTVGLMQTLPASYSHSCTHSLQG